MRKPRVLIEVRGCGRYRTKRKVDVFLVDYDAIEGGDLSKVPEDFYEAFVDLREALRNDDQGGPIVAKLGRAIEALLLAESL